MNPVYKDLYFGKSDSRNEANESLTAFVRSYVDLDSAYEQVVEGKMFLVLGPKGTGKSALALYVQAREDEGKHLSTVRDAASLPLAEIPRLQTGQPAGPERTVVAWKFILLCNYLEILLRDKTCTIHRNKEAVRVAKLLREFGFMGDAVGRALLTASTTTIAIPIPKLGQVYKRESRKELNIYSLLPYLESWVVEADSELRHVLLLDGLDSIFLNDLKYDESLASLVQAAYSLNQLFSAGAATGSIVLLLRNDVFARIALSLPDSQKMRDDLSFDLDWRILSGGAGVNAPLIQLVNKKAGHALGIEAVDVLGYFPKRIRVGGKSGPTRDINTLRYLLNLTRHTPRDLLRLFEEIRKVEASGVFSSRNPLSDEVIREGMLQYATKYFVGAIRNEFAGYEGGPESAEAAITALKHMEKQKFDRAKFRTALAETTGTTPTAAEVDRLLTLLFYAGALGNLVATSGESYMQFYHRRDEAQIYLGGQFILHNALLHAWNLQHSV